MIDGLEKVTCMISRYAIFEIVYFQRPAAASSELKSSLVMLYSSILTFLAHSYHYFGQRASKRFLKSGFESSASDIDDLLAKIETREREVDRVAQLVGIELLHEASDNIGSLRSTTEILSTQMTLLNTQFGERGQNAISAEHVLELVCCAQPVASTSTAAVMPEAVWPNGQGAKRKAQEPAQQKQKKKQRLQPPMTSPVLHRIYGPEVVSCQQKLL